MAAVVHPIRLRRPVAGRPDLRLVPGGRLRSRPATRALPPGTYARRRLIAVLLVVALLVAIRLVPSALGGGPLTTPEPVSTGAAIPAAARSYVVQPGDTLWSIARRLDPHGDVRVTVDRLAAAHDGATVQVGERLVLP
jgi:LysM repeat protein